MPRHVHFSDAPSPHRVDPLLPIVARLVPDLSPASRRRVAVMAEIMRETAENDQAVTRSQLIAAGYSGTEIDTVGEVAKAVLAEVDGTVPDEAIEPFSAKDAGALRRFVATRQTASWA